MARKKKEPTEGADEQGTLLEDYVIPQKIIAFKEYYKSCEPNIATEKMGEIRLRQFFKAYPCSLGDPLTIYLQRLEDAGYKMRVVPGCDEPVICVIEQTSGGMLELDVI